jgi:hypothetical protein
MHDGARMIPARYKNRATEPVAGCRVARIVLKPESVAVRQPK